MNDAPGRREIFSVEDHGAVLWGSVRDVQKTMTGPHCETLVFTCHRDGTETDTKLVILRQDDRMVAAFVANRTDFNHVEIAVMIDQPRTLPLEPGEGGT